MIRNITTPHNNMSLTLANDIINSVDMNTYDAQSNEYNVCLMILVVVILMIYLFITSGPMY